MKVWKDCVRGSTKRTFNIKGLNTRRQFIRVSKQQGGQKKWWRRQTFKKQWLQGFLCDPEQTVLSSSWRSPKKSYIRSACFMGGVFFFVFPRDVWSCILSNLLPYTWGFHVFSKLSPGALAAAPFRSPTSNALVMTPSVTAAIGIDGQGLKGIQRISFCWWFLVAIFHRLGLNTLFWRL